MVTRLHDEEAIFRREIADAEHEIEELNIFCSKIYYYFVFVFVQALETFLYSD